MAVGDRSTVPGGEMDQEHGGQERMHPEEKEEEE